MKTYHLSPSQLFVGSLLVLAMGLALIYLVDSRYFKQRQLNAAGLNAQAVVTMISRGEHLVSAANQTTAEVTALTTNPAKTTPANITNTYNLPVWKSASNKTGTPSIPLSDRVQTYKIVEVETHPTSYPFIGQEITLPLFDDQQVNAKVESIDVLANGDYSLRGHLSNHGNDYPFAMTYGEQSVFATITTPEGSYSMESVNGLGWLYKNPAEPELTTPGNNDYLEPPKN